MVFGKQPTVWVLTDKTTGHNNQVIGIAENLVGDNYIKKDLSYNIFANLPSKLKLKTESLFLSGISVSSAKEIAPPWPDIIISAGRKVAPIALQIKKRSESTALKFNCILCHCMLPSVSLDKFDLIAVPSHDEIPPEFENAKNIIRTIGAPHRVNAARLKKEIKAWETKFSYFSPPFIGVLVGGGTGKTSFSRENALKFAQHLNKLAKICNDATLLITTSRRTPEVVKKVLKETIDCSYYFHDVKTGGGNPYFAFLGMSNLVVVTGDSISMCTEACATGKHVFIYADGISPIKHQRFHQKIYGENYAKPLTQEQIKKFAQIFDRYYNGELILQNKELNPAKEVAEIIKTRLFIK